MPLCPIRVPMYWVDITGISRKKTFSMVVGSWGSVDSVSCVSCDDWGLGSSRNVTLPIIISVYDQSNNAYILTYCLPLVMR